MAYGIKKLSQISMILLAGGVLLLNLVFRTMKADANEGCGSVSAA